MLKSLLGQVWRIRSLGPAGPSDVTASLKNKTTVRLELALLGSKGALAVFPL